MFIIWGTHHYGQIGGGRGNSEHVTTRFGHLYWFPIFPIESRWVTRRLGDQLLGIDVKLSLRSVAATYLQFWVPVIALGVGATRTIPGIAASIALAALSVWSWTWSRARTGRERRRAQLNQLAFETACDPLIRKAGQCEALRPAIDARFAEVSAGRTPDDVARLGADSPLQAALAYASLRLVAATAKGPTARKARAASERVLDRLTDREADALRDGGPYRGQSAAAATPDDLDAATATAVAQQDRAFNEALAAARGPTHTAWDNDPENPVVKAQIARNKGAKWKLDLTLKGWLMLGIGGTAFLGFVGYKLYQDEVSARHAMAELRGFTDELCDCPTKACAMGVLGGRADELDDLEKVARDGFFNDGDIEDLAKRVERCAREKAMLPE